MTTARWERNPLDVARGANHIVLVDLDNWSRLLLLPVHELLPAETVVIGFASEKWFLPRDAIAAMDAMAEAGRFALRRCGTRKDAADFQIVSFYTTLDRKLPRHVPMTIVSGDGGFGELSNSTNLIRRPRFVKPHLRSEQDVLEELLRIGDSAADVQPGSDARPSKRQHTSRLSHAANAKDLAAAQFVWDLSEAGRVRVQVGDEVLVPRSVKRTTDPALTVGEVKSLQTDPVAAKCRLCDGYHSSSQGYRGQMATSVFLSGKTNKTIPLYLLGLLKRQPEGQSPSKSVPAVELTVEEPPPWPGVDLPPWRLGERPTAAEMSTVAFTRPGKRTAAAEAGDCVVCCLPSGLVWGRLEQMTVHSCDGVWLKSALVATDTGGSTANEKENTVDCWEVAIGTAEDAKRVVVPLHLMALRRANGHRPSSTSAAESEKQSSSTSRGHGGSGSGSRGDEAMQRVSSWLATGTD
jgi:hypothetical protein|eukprot:COSAG06_NODE_7390_length_2521_cov_13.238646_2_plen_465_part_00